MATQFLDVAVFMFWPFKDFLVYNRDISLRIAVNNRINFKGDKFTC
jgi:hypothetical protein